MENQATLDGFDGNADATTLPTPRKTRRGPPRSVILVVTTIIGLLHAYVGFRLLPASLGELACFSCRP